VRSFRLLGDVVFLSGRDPILNDTGELAAPDGLSTGASTAMPSRYRC
jgi:hypothetical protein